MLGGSADFSLEQAEKLSQYFGHSEDQTLYFLWMVQYARAGSLTLKKIFEDQMTLMIEKRQVLKNRLDYSKILSPSDQAIFYSSWIHGAIHVLVSVSGCQTERGISDYLGLPIQKTSEVLNFLEQVGLVIRSDGKYKVGTSHIHLGSDSGMISKHHTNWRMRAIQSLDLPFKNNLHYSSVITCSREDVILIREYMVQTIEKIRATVKKSEDEEAFSYAFDLFGLKSQS